MADNLVLGVLKEEMRGETRVAMTPDVAKKFEALGVRVLIESQAGEKAYFSDEDYDSAIVSKEEVLKSASWLLCVQPPSVGIVDQFQSKTIFGSLSPYLDRDKILKYLDKKITTYATECIPRISKAQSMDTLSSQAAVAGYLSALMGANECPKFFPMLTYAAGTIRPARVLVIGAGVAGLQAIATAKRLGAIVEGYDIRPETKEQIESLGAKFVDVGVSAQGDGGYARELTKEEQDLQAEKLAKAVSRCDVLICTAAIPGKKSPKIITQSMVCSMSFGSVIIDMAAEGGGNCEGTQPGKSVMVGPAKIVGPLNLPSKMPVHASEMFSKNLFNFLSPFIQYGKLNLDLEDEIIQQSCITQNGAVLHAGVKEVFNFN